MSQEEMGQRGRVSQIILDSGRGLGSCAGLLSRAGM